jgi:glycosyltransferase involved in cell wall biosynthesis
MDFLVHTPNKCSYDDEAQELGARIIYNPNPKNPLLYGYNFIRNYRKYGPYDIVHSHVHHYSGYVLFLAWLCGVPTRIAHSHSNTRKTEEGQGLFRRSYLQAMEMAIKKYATQGIAASRRAAESLFGPGWESDPRWQILYCGIDLEPFKKSVDKRSIRENVGIPEKSYVIGHVGRFAEPKNHKFLMQIAVEIVKRTDDVYFLLVGDGPLRPRMMERAEELGLKERIIFTGVRSDVPDLMLGAMDLFLFPSLYEGLGIVLIEAQAAGLPCVISDVVPEEADIVKPLIHRVSLNLPAPSWAEKIIEMREKPTKIEAPEIAMCLFNCPFNINNCIKDLERIYKSNRTAEN